MEVTTQSSIRTKYILKSILFCVVFTGLFVVFSFLKAFVPGNFERLAHGIIGTFVAFLTTWLFLRFDKKRFADIGLKFERTTLRKFFTGVFIGVGIMGLMAMSVIYFSGVRVETNPASNPLHFLLATLPLIPLAFMEELGFRGYPLEILKNKAGTRLAIIITSILFAIYHIVNGWTLLASFLGPAIWGLVFGLAAIYSRGIAMPTGIHYAANLTTSAFGAANNTVSIWILKQPGKLTTENHEGTDWITIIPAGVLLVAAIACLEIYLRRKKR
jgi:membrane protease YdiL (CAAX protease family)